MLKCDACTNACTKRTDRHKCWNGNLDVPLCSVGCKMHLAKYCCQHLKKVERIFNAPVTKVKCKGVVKLSASSVNYKGIIATHSIDGAKWYWFFDFIHSYYTVCWCHFQPRLKVPKLKLLFLITMMQNKSESVKKSICQQVSLRK